MAWIEDDHPRKENGEFTYKNKAPSSEDGDYDKTMSRLVDIYSSTPAEDKAAMGIGDKKKGKSKDEFFGEEFRGYKGEAAIEKLLKEQRGHIKNAFERSELGGIDLVWGDENGGLLHVIRRRDYMKATNQGSISGIDMVRKIPEIINKGKIDYDEFKRVGIMYKEYRVALRDTFDDEKINWVVSAMVIKQKK